MISNANYAMICRVAKDLEHCRGSTIKEQNAFRNLKLLQRKLTRKRNTDDTIRRNSTGGKANTELP